MHLSKRFRSFVLSVLLCVLGLQSCSKAILRGHEVSSPDGGTYLVVDDDNGGVCGSIRVDGRDWPQPLNTPHPIAPGTHSIACGDGAGLQFTVAAGTTFHFDYWGP